MLKIMKVSGESLAPEFHEGDFVLIAKIPFVLNRLKPGDVVAFYRPEYGVMIKKIDFILPGGAEFFVIGTHDLSLDSRLFGPIKRGELIRKVIWRIQRPR